MEEAEDSYIGRSTFYMHRTSPPNCLAMAAYNGWKFMVFQTINLCHWKLMVCVWGGGLS